LELVMDESNDITGSDGDFTVHEETGSSCSLKCTMTEQDCS